MANTFVVSRGHLILGLCLPLAVVLGYLLAEPLDSGSLAVFVLLGSVLAFPLLLKWHHPLLVLSWNAAISPFFLPGSPALWMLMSALSLCFGILERSVNPGKRFMAAPGVARSLLCLLAVVMITALVTGGFGIRAFGSSSYGGRGYFVIAAAVAGYFALSSQAVPRHRANLIVAFFLLSGVTAVVSNLAYMAGPGFYFLYELFPAGAAIGQAQAEGALDSSLVRLTGMAFAAQAVFGYVLARYGIRGVFDLSRPWRLGLFLAAVFLSMFGGYRSVIVFFGMTFIALFIVEKLWRTRVALGVLGCGLVAMILLVSFVDRMPMSVQRTLSFLPLEIDPAIKQASRDSTEWRLEMWKLVLPEVPKHLFLGKGYTLDPQALFLSSEGALRGFARSYEGAAYAGDYHNGLLSLLIPFGLYGLAAFLWFIGAGVRLLCNNFRFGAPALRQVNGFLLAFFLARTAFFFLVFGAFYGELFYFTGILGVSVALNHGQCQPGAEPPNTTD